MANEVTASVTRRKEVGFIFKIDFEKAYDSMEWSFLFQCVETFGFSCTSVS